MTTKQQVLEQLEALGDSKRRAYNAKNGAHDNQFGVKNGDLRKLAKKIKTDHKLARELWATGNLDARMLAILIVKPKMLSADELDAMVRSLTFAWVADWLNNYLVKKHPEREALRKRWIADDNPWVARSGWSLTAVRVKEAPDGLDLKGLLDRLEGELSGAAPPAQWTMNGTLVAVGIHSPEHRERAMAIGEALGVYRDYPVSKGCTSPFAPLWITEMVRRQG
ncbi:MAG: DNA alkylation repair protein [Nannocystaceae bacterium]